MERTQSTDITSLLLDIKNEFTDKALMENNIVQDFQKLRVISGNSFLTMDDLVQDLTNALEDVSHLPRKGSVEDPTGSSGRKHTRKRRGRNRRTHMHEKGNMSEASESSIDEALRDYMENVAQQSDSDDLAIAHQIVRLTMPLSGNYVPAVESDSVNENFSPRRPQRRRKKYKSMAVDLEPGMSVCSGTKRKKRGVTTVQGSGIRLGSSPVDASSGIVCGSYSNREGEDSIPGKRKRNHRSRADYVSSQDSQTKTEEGANDDVMETGSFSQESSGSSSISSNTSDTDGYEDAREADDEQSDFFHEPGPACGIPGIIPWWENERLNEDTSMVTDSQFQQILNGSFEHLPRSSQMAFKARMTKLMRKSGREFRFGRRNLHGTIPGYTVSRFLQERHKWNAMQKKHLNWQHPSNGSGNGNGSGGLDTKRQRKTPPPYPDAGLVGEYADPIPESNIGNRMLQNMGWTPGSGLGADGCGMKTPITAMIRPKRQGLGHGLQSNSNEPDS